MSRDEADGSWIGPRARLRPRVILRSRCRSRSRGRTRGRSDSRSRAPSRSRGTDQAARIQEGVDRRQERERAEEAAIPHRSRGRGRENRAPELRSRVHVEAEQGTMETPDNLTNMQFNVAGDVQSGQRFSTSQGLMCSQYRRPPMETHKTFNLVVAEYVISASCSPEDAAALVTSSPAHIIACCVLGSPTTPVATFFAGLVSEAVRSGGRDGEEPEAYGMFFSRLRQALFDVKVASGNTTRQVYFFGHKGRVSRLEKLSTISQGYCGEMYEAHRFVLKERIGEIGGGAEEETAVAVGFMISGGPSKPFPQGFIHAVEQDLGKHEVRILMGLFGTQRTQLEALLRGCGASFDEPLCQPWRDGADGLVWVVPAYIFLIGPCKEW